ncbi:hypothetical protein ACHAW5_004614 [Stephanodiscus triporus]|uniref:Protein FAM184A/B N-terminal domain-containing protein n=1 Tax=Stephanodiscus triporus TaxID=2934178 RepID=A0ABD3QTI9_9STRA
MSECTEAAEAAPMTHTKESHYQLSKKVAQLIKVIVHLNTDNENYTADKKRLIDAHDEEMKVVKHDADVRLKLLQDEVCRMQSLQGETDEMLKTLQGEADERQKMLQEEVCTMREVAAKHAAREKESHELLALIECKAKEEVEELQRNHERERASQAQTVRDISHSLEEQSRQYQEKILCLRNELAVEHKQQMESFREELTSSHADEILLLKSRHEKNVLRLKSDASEQGKLAVESAVTKMRLECDERLQQLSSCVKKCEDIQAKALDVVCREKESLKEELEILKEKEKKLQSEVMRLQTSIDSVSAINQDVVKELRSKNYVLSKNLDISRDASDKQLKQNDELKALLDRIDAQKTLVESELDAAQLKLDKQCQLSLSQLDECNSRTRTLQAELDGAKTSNEGMAKELSTATAEIAVLVKYKHCLQRTLPPLLQILKRDAYQSKNDIKELEQMFTSFIGNVVKWKQRLTCAHVNETSKFIEREKVQRDQVAELCTALEVHKISLAEAKNVNTHLEKKIELAAWTAQSAASARMGERSSWVKALEDTKEQHKKELARMCCKSLDEVNILGNRIAELEATIEKQRESHNLECQIMVTDWQQKLECHDAHLSRLKSESAIEVQGLTQKLAELNGYIASKERDFISLVQSIDSMREQQMGQEIDHRHELEFLSKRYQSEHEESKCLYEQIRQKYDEALQSEREKANESAISQKRIDVLNERIASERSEVIREVAEIKVQLGGLRSMAIQHINDIKQEWKSICCRVVSTKLNLMKQTHDATRQKQKQEIEQLRTAEMSFDSRLAAGEKEARDAKTMLFNTIRESETKLERALRRLSEDHKREIEALAKKNRIECEVIIRSFEDKIRSMALQDENDRQLLASESKRKEALMMEDFTKEKSKLLLEINAIGAQCEEKLQAANERWNSRPSLLKDLEMIKTL